MRGNYTNAFFRTVQNPCFVQLHNGLQEDFAGVKLSCFQVAFLDDIMHNQASIPIHPPVLSQARGCAVFRGAHQVPGSRGGIHPCGGEAPADGEGVCRRYAAQYFF